MNKLLIKPTKWDKIKQAGEVEIVGERGRKG
jgi:hypothetical protein